MASDGVLFDYEGSLRAAKILIAAKFSKKNIVVASNFKLGETNKSAEFLKKFPLGKVPAFEHNGVDIFETNAISHYVSNAQLRGTTTADQAHVLQWISFADNEITPAAANWLFPCLNVMQFNKQATERAKEDVRRALDVLNQHLESRTFLVGERITLADVHVAVALLQLFKMVLDASFRAPFGNVTRWFVTMVNQPEVIAVLGAQTTLCETPAQFDPKKFAEVQGKAAGGEKAKGKKGDQQQPAAKDAKSPKKKRNKTKSGSESADNTPKETKPADDEEDDVPREKESKDPFAALPPSKMNFDEWKKMYSNNDTKTVALPWLFEHFDAENLSVWRCQYKYKDELKRIFMTCNLVGGMFQRLDRLRKHGFGSMCIFGEDNDNTIAGIWFWRGHGLAFELSEDLQVDYESYEWKKLDWAAPETRKMVSEYLAWEGDFNDMAPLKFNQGKIYK